MNLVLRVTRSALDVVDRVSHLLSLLTAYLASASIAFLMIVISWDVIGRSLFERPFQGAPELATNLVVAIAFLGMPYAFRQDAHIRSTVIVDRMPIWVSDVMNRVGHLVGILIFALIARATWKPALQAFRTGEFQGDGALRIPTWPIRWIIFGAAALLVLEALSAVAARGQSAAVGESAVSEAKDS